MKLVKNIIKNLIFLFFLTFLINCENLKKNIGLEKDIPDEFMVQKRKSLAIPPNYDLIPPDKLESKIIKDDSNIKDLINEELKISKKDSVSSQNSSITNSEKEILKDLENKQ